MQIGAAVVVATVLVVALVVHGSAAALPSHEPGNRAVNGRNLFGMRVNVGVPPTGPQRIGLRTPSSYGPLNCSVFREVQAITHEPGAHGSGRGAIKIRMRKGSPCRNPFFRIRLSGAALAIASTGSVVNSMRSTNNFYTAKYQLVQPGTYYVEVLMLYCDADVRNTESLLKISCPEDLLCGPVNQKFSFRLAAGLPARGPGMWRWAPGGRPGQGPELPTRFQKTGNAQTCEASRKNQGARACCITNGWTTGKRTNCPFKLAEVPLEGTTMERVVPALSLNYQWVPTDTARITLTKKKACYLGASHTRILTADIQKYFHLNSQYVDIRFPDQWKTSMIGDCAIFVIAAGQWCASWRSNKGVKHGNDQHFKQPYAPSDYSEGIEKIIKDINKNAPQVKIWVRTVNYNPMGSAAYVRCPAQEWRVPPILEGYNDALRSMVRRQPDVGFIDLEHVVGPMWDTSADWNHYYGAVFKAEATMIVRAISRPIHTKLKAGQTPSQSQN